MARVWVRNDSCSWVSLLQAVPSLHAVTSISEMATFGGPLPQGLPVLYRLSSIHDQTFQKPLVWKFWRLLTLQIGVRIYIYICVCMHLSFMVIALLEELIPLHITAHQPPSRDYLGSCTFRDDLASPKQHEYIVYGDPILIYPKPNSIYLRGADYELVSPNHR